MFLIFLALSLCMRTCWLHFTLWKKKSTKWQFSVQGFKGFKLHHGECLPSQTEINYNKKSKCTSNVCAFNHLWSGDCFFIINVYFFEMTKSHSSFVSHTDMLLHSYPAAFSFLNRNHFSSSSCFFLFSFVFEEVWGPHFFPPFFDP